MRKVQSFIYENNSSKKVLITFQKDYETNFLLNNFLAEQQDQNLYEKMIEKMPEKVIGFSLS